MKTRAIALTTSALVAVATFAAPASAGDYVGKINLGVGYVWETFDDNGDWESNTSGIHGSASVNVPYNDRVNLQFDIFGDESMDNYGDGTNSFYGGFGAGMHLNYRDNEGALGVFGSVGRAVASSDWASNFVVFAAGLEGQYYCNSWTLSGQIGYLDSDDWGWLIQDAGFVNVGATYYASSKLKLTGSVGYIDGATSGTDDPEDVSTWAWTLGAEYLFGKSVPVSTYIEYRGQASEWEDGGESNTEIDRHAVNVGVRFYFGGNDLMKADRDGAGMQAPAILEWGKYYTD